MNWTATIVSSSTDANGILDVSVRFDNTDGSGNITESYTQSFHGVTNSDNLNQLIQQQLDYYTNRDTASITPGLWTPPAQPAIQATPPLTQGQLAVQQAQATFTAAYQTLQQYNRAIAAGIITNQDPGYQAALAAAQKAWSVDYLTAV